MAYSNGLSKSKSKPTHSFLASISLLVLLSVFSAAASAVIVVTARIKPPRVSSADNRENGVTQIQHRVQMVRLTLYDSSIYPSEVRANSGRITLAVEDLTGSSSGLVIQQLDAAAPGPIAVLSKATNRLRSRNELVLAEGRYELVDPGWPGNRALLIVEP